MIRTSDKKVQIHPDYVEHSTMCCDCLREIRRWIDKTEIRRPLVRCHDCAAKRWYARLRQRRRWTGRAWVGLH